MRGCRPPLRFILIALFVPAGGLSSYGQSLAPAPAPFVDRASAANDGERVPIVLKEGRPLSVALDSRVRIRHVGQPITGTVTEPVYVYDRVVVPAGAKVSGRIARLENPPKGSRALTMAGGDFTPKRRVTVEFDLLILPDGQRRSIHTVVTNETGPVKREVASGATAQKGAAQPPKPPPSTEIDQAKAEVMSWAKQEYERKKRQTTQRVTDGLAAIKQPNKLGRIGDRLGQMALAWLPYHPQFLGKGTTYTVTMASPLDFGVAVPAARASDDMMPAPDSVLNARLVTPLDSSTTPRGTPIKAVLTEPVFAADGTLILPEGAELDGEVTYAQKAGRFRRNGQLRFLFESVSAPDREPTTLLASLNAVDAVDGDRIVVDEEGGITIDNSNTRFIEPAVSALLLREALSRNRRHRRARPPGGSVSGVAKATSRVGIRGIGGAIGFGMIGAVASQYSPHAALAFGAYGSAKTFYTNVFGKGREVSFQADTPIQLQLASGTLSSE
jgi:hypothetical protein